MHPSESNLHQMDKFENPTGTQPMMRTGYSSGILSFLKLNICYNLVILNIIIFLYFYRFLFSTNV